MADANVWTKERADACIERYKHDWGPRRLWSCEDFSRVLSGFQIPINISAEFYLLVDADRNQTIEPEEFEAFLNCLIGVDLNDRDAHRRCLFNLVDKDHNGLVDAQELSQYCKIVDLNVDPSVFQSYFDRVGIEGMDFDAFMQWRYQERK